MPDDQQPDYFDALARRIGQQIASGPAFDEFRRHLASSLTSSRARWQEYVAQVLTSTLNARRDRGQDPTTAFTAELQRHIQDFDAYFTVGTSWTEVLQALPETELVAYDVHRLASQAVQQTTSRLDTEEATADGIPDELLTAIAD
ncbi:hypothetical protein [Streptomyces sp. NPDC059455]|uniref:hypothetical protein n=1 Tax=Streptomyces sp. NPDC059455 TaxID=3346837 RepID=UPI0036C8C811